MLGGGGSLKNKVNETKENKLTNESLAIYVSDKKVKEIPSKDSGYYFDRDKSNCTNEAKIEWDSVSWSPTVSVKGENQERVSCNLYFTTNYREGILNGTDPVLKDEMIPITLENDGTVKKADLTKPWYSYADKKWANAVLLQNSYDALDAEGKVNSATKQDGYVSFDGVDDYIDLGLANYDFDKSITMTMRVKIKEVATSGTRMLLTNFENGGVSFEYYNGKVYASILKEDYSTYLTTFKYTYDIEKFFTITLTYDGSNMSLFIDGVLMDNVLYTSKIISTVMPLVIGANPNANNSFGQYGKVDVKQVAIYNRVLSEDEIKNNMTSEIKITDNTGLLKYVDFTSKQNYESNEVIPEDVIESYFVWIPKYRYKLWNLGNYDSLTGINDSEVHSIDILFGDYNTDDSMGKECTTPMISGATGNCKVGDYMTHPAFISIPSTGFWVGKFETGYKGATDVTSAKSNTFDISKIVIKPNVYSWRSVQLVNGHLNSYSYKRNLNSHMIKNTEWGAVAYLQHSKYGSQINVRLNNTDNHLTGYAANSAPTCGYTGKKEACNGYCENDSCSSPYNTEIGYLASTTGNVYGIYDMSGGDWEYVMFFIKNDENKILSGLRASTNSGFEGVNYDGTTQNGQTLPSSQYYDLYIGTSSSNSFYNRILGDATGEMGPFGTIKYTTSSRVINSWHKNQSVFVRYETPFLTRGGTTTIGENSGVFAFDNQYGQACSAFRIILTPTKGEAS